MDSDTLLLYTGVLCAKFRRSKNWNRTSKKKILILFSKYLDMKYSRNKKLWVRPIFTERMRRMQGHSDNLIMEMRLNDTEKYFNYLRMTPLMFDKLLEIVGPQIERQCVVRDPIPVKTRLELTLRYLADGSSMTSLAYDFRLGKATVSEIISETCEVIWDKLRNIVFPDIKRENWEAIAKKFEDMWNFKNCIGAIDGKHVVVEAPPNCGSSYYNYKNCHSIHLLAVADAQSRFIMVDIGAQGRFSDGGVFKESAIGRGFENQSFRLPPAVNIPELNSELPFVLVGDEAFPLSVYMMRPYPRSGKLDRRKKVFNYRLSRARRMVESAFGILSARWRIYRKPIIAGISTVIKIVQASVCLHNFIMKYEEYLPSRERRYSMLTPEERVLPTNGLENNRRTGSNFYSRNAAHIRESFATYFDTIGAVDFQWERALGNQF